MSATSTTVRPTHAAARRDATDALRVGAAASSLGTVLVAVAAGGGVRAILLGDDEAALREDLQQRFPRATLVNADATTDALVARVVALVERPASAFDAPLDPAGTSFQRLVWNALREIPAGATATYAEIARRIGAPTSARAVARACATNPIAVVVPCHRVVRGDGGLAGYRWGLERKRALLAREAGA